MFSYIKRTLGYSTDLVEAVKSYNVSAVRTIIQSKSQDINLQDDQGYTAIMHAVDDKNYSIEIIHLLLDQHNIDTTNALCLAAKHNHIEILQKLMQHHSNNIDELYDNMTPLMFAAKYNNTPDTLNFLLKNNAEIDIKNINEQNVLMIASERHDKYSVSFAAILLQNNIDIDAQDKEGETALMKAVRSKNINAIRLLLSYNPNLLLKNNQSQDTLYYFTITNNDQQIWNILSEYINKKTQPQHIKYLHDSKNIIMYGSAIIGSIATTVFTSFIAYINIKDYRCVIFPDICRYKDYTLLDALIYPKPIAFEQNLSIAVLASAPIGWIGGRKLSEKIINFIQSLYPKLVIDHKISNNNNERYYLVHDYVTQHNLSSYTQKLYTKNVSQENGIQSIELCI